MKTEPSGDTTLDRPTSMKRKVSDTSVEPMDVDQSHMDLDDSGGATKSELLRRLQEREQHIRNLRQDFKTSEDEYAKALQREIDELQEKIKELEDDNQENIDKYSWAMDNHSRAVERIRALEHQAQQREEGTRLTATRFGNLQTKYNEKEKELAKLQDRYDRLAMSGVSPMTQDAMRDLREQINRQNTEILKYQSDLECYRQDVVAKQDMVNEKDRQLQQLQGNLEETDRVLQERNRQMQEMNKRYEDAVAHGRDLQERLNSARAPDVVVTASGAYGSCYHLPDCNHMHGGGKTFRKCKTCLP